MVVWLALVFALPVHAQDGEAQELTQNLYEKSGAGAMYDALDDETKENLGRAGVRSSQDIMDGGVSGKSVLTAVSEMLADKTRAPLKAVLGILVTVILCRMCAGFENDGLSQTASLVGAFAAAGMVIVPLIRLIAALKTVLQTASGFLLAATPVYAGLLAASGKVQTGASYAVLTMGAGQLLSVISTALIIPLLNIFLALSVVSAVSEMNLQPMTESLYSFSKWLLVLLVTFFTGALSLQTVLQSQMDGMSEKAVKWLASSAIPIVGGAIGDSLSIVAGGIQLVKSGVGAFGILASLLIFLPLLIETLLWSLVCGAGKIMADLFECTPVGQFMASCMAVTKMLAAVLISVCAVCVVSASVVIAVRAGP